MKTKTFAELYEEAKAMPRPATPAQEFISEVARATGRQPISVYAWLSGRQQPDVLVKKAIGALFGVDPDGLFPNTIKKQET